MRIRRHCAKPRLALPPFDVDPTDPVQQRQLCEWRSWSARKQWLVSDFLIDLEEWWTRHPQTTRSQLLRFIRHWAHAHDWDELADHFDQLEQKRQKKES
jgi:hypothetical protein